jgi:glycerol-3-phosphate dehydrogenase (NAD(P)+)
MPENVTIIGDGGMGTICAVMLSQNDNPVRWWSAFEDQARELSETRENRRFLPGLRIPDEIEIICDGAAAFEMADLVFSAVPAQYTREVWQRLEPHYTADTPICSVTKGIENETLMRPTEVIADVLGSKDPQKAVLSGPCIAPEIAGELPATVTVASEHPELARRVQVLITRPYFRVYTSEDMTGVEMAGAAKNVIAIAAGILDGMGMGCNAKSALITRGLVEIGRLGEAVGAKPGTFSGLSGMGDLVTTCISPVGRNRSFGEAIGGGMTVEEALASTESVIEGVATTQSLLDLARQTGVEMPLTAAVHQVLFEGKSPREAIAELMNRPLRSEA